MSKEVTIKSDNHFVIKENWQGSKIEGHGVSISVNKTIIPISYKSKMIEWKDENSIKDLIKFGFVENVTTEIYRIMAEYMALNIKSRSINTATGLDVLFEYITEECGNLELQELNFIFKSGIMGKFGIIYNDISIDTICGKDGWFETYYRDYRKLRPEPKVNNVIPKLTGKEITEQQFYNENPDQKIYSELRTIRNKALTNTLKLDDVKLFYTSKGLSLDDFKDDQEVYSYNYFQMDEEIRNCIGEMNYILEQHMNFILANIYKTKK